jgi:hypothetical protein
MVLRKQVLKNLQKASKVFSVVVGNRTNGE